MATDAADAVDDHQIALTNPGLLHRLIGRGHRIRDDRQVRELDTGRGEPLLVDETKTPRRHDNMSRKAAVNIVARHFLVRTNCGLAAAASIALAAGYDRGHDDRATDPLFYVCAAIDHTPADLVTKRERQIVLGADAVVVIAEVGMADAAAGNLDDFVRCRWRSIKFSGNQRFALAGHH